MGGQQQASDIGHRQARLGQTQWSHGGQGQHECLEHCCPTQWAW